MTDDSERQHLVGYVIGALDADEHQRVSDALRRSPDLQRQHDLLVARLAPSRDDRAYLDPPAGLAGRTCRRLAELTGAALEAAPPGADAATVELPARQAVPRLSSDNGRAARWHFWSLSDLIVTGGIALVAAMLFFPAVAHSRFRSQVLSCQNNVREIGLALQMFAQHHHGRFPQESLDGPRAFAGVFGPDLQEGGYLSNARALLCPAARQRPELAHWKLPTLSQIELAKGEARRKLQLTAAGTYAYCLGYYDRGQFTGPRDNRRSTFAILADMPCLQSKEFRSASHLGRGQNVLFEDGHVQFLVGCKPQHCNDSLFVNDQGKILPGVHDRDSVLAEGWTAPVPDLASNNSRSRSTPLLVTPALGP